MTKTLERPRLITGKLNTVSDDGVKQMVLAFRSAKLAAVVDDFQIQPGMIYTSVRAISARINQNFDAWPGEELKKSYHTFLGKPLFVNHANFDPERARGRVVASRYIEKGADKYIQVIQEADAMRYPKLGHELRTGGLDSVSMGVEAGFTVCSFCNNKATDVFDMCDHVKFHKGSHLPDPRTGEPKLVFEWCHKLGFFELSYVFDPADETAVVSKVLVASTLPRAKKKQSVTHQAWGEVRAPEDIDTLRLDDDDSPDDYEFVSPYKGDDAEEEADPNVPFANQIPSPPELRTPDFDQTKRMDRAQEAEGLDNDRRVEDVEEVGTPQDQEQQLARPVARKSRRKAMGRTRTSTRTNRRYAADEDTPPWLNDRDEEGSEAPPEPSGPPPPAAAEDEGYGDEPEAGDDGGDDFGGGGSVEDLVDQIQDGLDQLQDKLGIDDSDDDYDEGAPEEELPPPNPAPAPAGPPPQFAAGKRRRSATRRRAADEDDDDRDDDDSDDKDEDDNKPPWLKEKKESRRRPATRSTVNTRSSAQKKRKSTKGAPSMAPTLSERGRVAAKGRRQHFADDQGYTDGGDRSRNDLGEQAETYIPSVYEPEGIGQGYSDGVPPEEPVEAPNGDEGKAPNSNSNLVAMKRQIDAQAADLQRKIQAYQRLAEEGVKDPDTVNPPLSGTEDQSLKGNDFQDTGLDDTQTQPDDGSREARRVHQSKRLFRSFNTWLRQATGRNWNEHSSGSLTRHAAHWAKGTGVPLQAMFPTLDSALREAKKAEDTRRAAVNRYADVSAESLETAAPDARVDTEKPVSNETSELAQSSQYPTNEFGHNAGDQDADPEMSSDSQIWAPDEGREASRQIMSDGMSATRLAEAYIACRLVDPKDKWKVAQWLQSTVRQATVDDRTKLLEAIYAANEHMFNPPARRTAAATGRRGGTVPPGFGSGRVASMQRMAADELSDPRFDSMMWLG